MSGETWRAVPGFEGRYEVSDLGRVRSLARKGGARRPEPLLLKCGRLPKGYVTVCLSPGRQHRYVHRLVVETFVGLIPPGLEINHKDGAKDNNRLSNLEVVSRRENLDHAIHVLGKYHEPPAQRGEANCKAILTEADVMEIRALAERERIPGRKRFRRGAGITRSLAARYGVSEVMIRNVITGRNWKCVP